MAPIPSYNGHQPYSTYTSSQINNFSSYYSVNTAKSFQESVKDTPKKKPAQKKSDNSIATSAILMAVGYTESERRRNGGFSFV